MNAWNLDDNQRNRGLQGVHSVAPFLIHHLTWYSRSSAAKYKGG
uniref:Uncharacterized protein n=1 Tax=Arundo donax TaxID=35708 RepID=A0A0A9HNS0_ARUDO